MLNNIGLGEIVVISAVLMLFFGGDKLPELAKGIREATKEFRTALNEEDEKQTGKKSDKK
jgi:sec-independent protein translocase protein TatA